MYVVSVEEELCTGCGVCMTGCPAQMFSIENGKCAVSTDECLGCQSCVSICPVGAIKVEEY